MLFFSPKMYRKIPNSKRPLLCKPPHKSSANFKFPRHSKNATHSSLCSAPQDPLHAGNTGQSIIQSNPILVSSLIYTCHFLFYFCLLGFFWRQRELFCCRHVGRSTRQQCGALLQWQDLPHKQHTGSLAGREATCIVDWCKLEPRHQDTEADFKKDALNFSSRLTQCILLKVLRAVNNILRQNVGCTCIPLFFPGQGSLSPPP